MSVLSPVADWSGATRAPTATRPPIRYTVENAQTRTTCAAASGSGSSTTRAAMIRVAASAVAPRICPTYSNGEVFRRKR